MSFNSRLKERREALGMSRAELAERLGVTVSAIGNYENGVSFPKEEILYKLFRALHVDPNYLWQDYFATSVSPFKVSIDEQQKIKKYRALDEHGKKVIDILLDEEHNRCVFDPVDLSKPSVIPIYCSSSRVSAGFGDMLEEYDQWDTVYIADTPLNRKADFVLIVDGDSMEPKYSDGDYILVRSQQQVEFSQIGVFAVNGNGFVKKFGGNRLISLNRKYPDIPFSESTDVQCFGLVLGKTEVISE